MRIFAYNSMYSRACTLIFTRSIRLQRKRGPIVSGSNIGNQSEDKKSSKNDICMGDPFAYNPRIAAPGELMPDNSEKKVKRRREKKKVPISEPKGMDCYGLTFPLHTPTTVDNQFLRLQQCLTPLSEVPYQKQLNMKLGYTKLVFKKLMKRLREEPHYLRLGPGLVPVESVKPSPEIFAYRNKDEFSVHTGADGNPKTVGYFVGSAKDTDMRCVPPTYLLNIRDSHKLVAKHFQKFIEKSSYESCVNFKLGGIWRTLTVRSNKEGDVMAIVTIFPDDMTDSKKEEIKSSLKSYFFEGEGSECNLSSLFLQVCKHTRCFHKDSPFELIEGKTHIEEKCLGANFIISPESFFQINTGAAEILYSSIKDIAELSSITTLMDICCGTGPISIISAPHVRGTIGIDISKSAINDAMLNAERNNISNCTFHNGKVEEILPLLGPSLNHCSNLTAVLNPSRGGLHPAVIQSLRECEAISKIVYVTCKPEGVPMNNFFQLMTTRKSFKNWSTIHKGKEVQSDGFMPRYVLPVDMFPHTKHLEMIILFERIPKLSDLDIY